MSRVDLYAIKMSTLDFHAIMDELELYDARRLALGFSQFMGHQPVFRGSWVSPQGKPVTSEGWCQCSLCVQYALTFLYRLRGDFNAHQVEMIKLSRLIVRRGREATPPRMITLGTLYKMEPDGNLYLAEGASSDEMSSSSTSSSSTSSSSEIGA